MRIAIPLFLMLLLPLQTAAQPAPSILPSDQPVENVTVEAAKIPEEQGIHDFVTHSGEATLFLGKVARWRQPICPETQGFIEPAAAMVTQRVRDMAAKIGAPVNPDLHCKANVLIYFTREPQMLLNQLMKRDENMLGFHNVSQTQSLGTFTHPVQAWYATATRDADGRLSLDIADNPFVEECASDVHGVPPQLLAVWMKRCGYTTEGNRGSLRDGLRSEMGRVTIIGDSGKLDAYGTDTLGDYVTMLALSQVRAFDGCQEFPTITNLLVPECRADRKPETLSEVDLAYLKALYHIDPTLSGQLQRSAIDHEMVEAFKRH